MQVTILKPATLNDARAVTEKRLEHSVAKSMAFVTLWVLFIIAPIIGVILGAIYGLIVGAGTGAALGASEAIDMLKQGWKNYEEC